MTEYEALDRIKAVVGAPGGSSPSQVAICVEQKLLFTYCAYCGHEERIDADASLISRHIATCDKHPMRRLEMVAIDLLAACQLALATIETYPSDEYLRAAIARLQAAIARAKEEG